MKTISSFFDQMATMYVDYYNTNGEEKTLDFVLNNHVSLHILTTLFENFVKEGEIEDITTLPKDKKEKYWTIACKHYETLPDRLKATRAIYALELITSNF